jgi:hypothetical protein
MTTSCEHINMPSDCIKDMEFIEQLSVSRKYRNSMRFVSKRWLKWNLAYADIPMELVWFRTPDGVSRTQSVGLEL